MNDELNPAQRRVVEAGLIDGPLGCVLQLPTGTGKTWLAERAIAQILSRGGRVIYLSPLRALAAELWERWRERFDGAGIFTGDFGRGRAYPTPWERARVLIMTPERLDACTRAWRRHWSWLPEVELLVIDELHLLGDPRRGPRLEGTVLRVRRLNPLLRVLALSATLGNLEELADWLEAVAFRDEWRAVPLSWKLRRFRRAEDKPALLADEVRRCCARGGQSLVFVQSRRRAESLAAHLRDEGLTASPHHAGLEAGARAAVEDAYRRRQLGVVVSTGTLEMGLNLPARQVVLYDLQRFDGVDFVPLSVATVWQRAGRAGRPGLDQQGEVVLLAPSWDRAAGRYPDGQFEPIRSGLGEERQLAEQVVAEVASGLCRSAAQLRRALGGSLACIQGRRLPVDAVVERMCEAGMLEVEEAPRRRLRATRAGRVAARLLLSPETVLALRRLRRSVEAPRYTFLDILLVSISTPDGGPWLPVDFEALEAMEARLGRERSALLEASSAEVARRLGGSGRRALAVIETALVARAWTRCGDADAVAADFGHSPFDVRALVERLERVLTALVALTGAEEVSASAAATDEPDLAERARALVRMVGHGLDEEAVTLTAVGGLGGVMARRLAAAGVGELEALALAEPEELASIRGLSRPRAARWIAEAGALVSGGGALRLRETGPTLGLRAAGWPPELDPYRLRRALELTVRPLEPGRWEVTGGLEPHLIERTGAGELGCDCPDSAATGRACKHLLALRLFQGEAETLALARRLTSSADAALDLQALWME